MQNNLTGLILTDAVRNLSLSDRLKLAQEIEKMNLLDTQKLIDCAIMDFKINVFIDGKLYDGPDEIHTTINGDCIQINASIPEIREKEKIIETVN